MTMEALDPLPAGVKHSIVMGMKPGEEASPARRPGRPLSFDRDAALHRAMLLFWRHGYEGTSLAELTAAMGVTPPSVYAAFGDKKRLFLEAVDRYLAGPVTLERMLDESPSARDAVAALLRGAAVGFTGAETPPGCLLASAAISGSAAADDVREHLASLRRDIEAKLRHRIGAAFDDGELPADAAADALAGHVGAVVQGLSTLARDGAPREKLLRVVAVAMTAWPAGRSGDGPSGGVPDAPAR